MPSHVLAVQEIAPTTKKNTLITNETTTIKTDSTSITVHHYNSNTNTNQAISPQRNLSLNLSPQYVDVQQQQFEHSQQNRKQSKHQLGQKATRSNRQLKAPLIKSTVATNLPTTTTTKIDANFTTTRKMFANVSNNLVGAISSDDAYSERALLLRGAENVAGSGVTQQLFNVNNSKAAVSAASATTTPTIIHDNNNQNSFNVRTKPTTTKITYNNNNLRNNYGSILNAHNIVDVGGGDQVNGGIDELDYLQKVDDDMLSDDVVPTINTGTVAVSLNDNDEQKNSQFQIRQNVTSPSTTTTTTTTSTNANKKTKMSKLGSKNVGLKR